MSTKAIIDMRVANLLKNSFSFSAELVVCYDTGLVGSFSVNPAAGC
jgi:hypothetical protein